MRNQRLKPGLTFLLSLAVGILNAPVMAASDIAISQVYGGGGNSGALYTHDFIELHNRSAAAVNVTGWSVQYASAAGTTWQRTLLTGTIPAGGYFLVQEAQGAGGSQALPTADASGTIAMSATAGKVALSTAGAVLSGACPAGLADQIGYGAANCFEGAAPASGLSNTTASQRAAAGCTDTDNNAADFASGSPVPRNAASAASICGIVVPPDPDPTPDATPISAIQGKGHLSPLSGKNVAGVEGVVTAVLGNGFYLQDPHPDTDPATSEALFVFTGAAPSVHVGDAVSVDGRVSEFRPGGSGGTTNLTTTELVSPTVRTLSSGNSLPAPILIGLGGRVPPKELIENDAAGNVETSGVFDPDSDGIDFYESLESMRVQVSEPVVVGPRNGFGEFLVLGDAGTGASLRTPRGGIKVRARDFNPEKIMVDDVLSPTPAVDVGDVFAGPIVGVLDYQFANFRIQPSNLPARIGGGLAREVSAPDCAGMLSAATFNVENLDPSDPAEKFARLAEIIVTNLRAPLLIALEEVQDNNGAVNDGTVDASLTAAKLIAAIQTAGGPVYTYKDIAPQNLQDGGEPGGNIRVGFLYQPVQGLTFVGRAGGTAVNSVKAVKTPTGIRLNYSPGRIDPLNTAFNNSRKPLVGEFSFQGRTLFVIANHFNSKGGDDPLFGRFQPAVHGSEIQRKQQAEAVRAFAQSLLALDPCARIVILGDLNDFEFSEAVQTLKGSILSDLIESLPENERYSYVFEGNSQSLDHILVSPTLAVPATFYDVVHVNSEFADQVSDHEPQRACFEKGPPMCPVNFP